MSETIREFLAEYTPLVIGTESTSHYQLINSGTEEPWRTFPASVEAEKVEGSVSDVASELATGRQVLRLQAISNTGSIRGQMSIAVEGRSVAARQAGSEQISHAKALAMNIQTADTQLANMSRRLEAADKRAYEMEERATAGTLQIYQMADMVHKMLMEKESNMADVEERRERTKMMLGMMETLTPILGQAVIVASKFVEMKVKIWEMKWENEARSAASQYQNPPVTKTKEN